VERDAKSLDRRMDDLLRRCREAGMNVTPQRMAIYRALLESEDHPSPELLYQRVRPKMPSLSLATIYKSLDALSRLGVVHRVSVAGDRKRYDANVDRHHHLVCTRCHKVVDFYDDALDAVAPPRKLAGFVAHALTVQVMGLCAACARGRRQ
jgi:Fur family peroxide stress response transcriptional regulator